MAYSGKAQPESYLDPDIINYRELNPSNTEVYDSDDPESMLGVRVEVLWGRSSTYVGMIDKYNPNTNMHHVTYDDGDRRWYSLWEKTFTILSSGEVHEGTHTKPNFDLERLDAQFTPPEPKMLNEQTVVTFEVYCKELLPGDEVRIIGNCYGVDVFNGDDGLELLPISSNPNILSIQLSLPYQLGEFHPSGIFRFKYVLIRNGEEPKKEHRRYRRPKSILNTYYDTLTKPFAKYPKVSPTESLRVHFMNNFQKVVDRTLTANEFFKVMSDMSYCLTKATDQSASDVVDRVINNLSNIFPENSNEHHRNEAILCLLAVYGSYVEVNKNSSSGGGNNYRYNYSRWTKKPESWYSWMLDNVPIEYLWVLKWEQVYGDDFRVVLYALKEIAERCSNDNQVEYAFIYPLLKKNGLDFEARSSKYQFNDSVSGEKYLASALVVSDRVRLLEQRVSEREEDFRVYLETLPPVDENDKEAVKARKDLINGHKHEIGTLRSLANSWMERLIESARSVMLLRDLFDPKSNLIFNSLAARLVHPLAQRLEDFSWREKYEIDGLLSSLLDSAIPLQHHEIAIAMMRNDSCERDELRPLVIDIIKKCLSRCKIINEKNGLVTDEANSVARAAKDLFRRLHREEERRYYYSSRYNNNWNNNRYNNDDDDDDDDMTSDWNFGIWKSRNNNNNKKKKKKSQKDVQQKKRQKRLEAFDKAVQFLMVLNEIPVLDYDGIDSQFRVWLEGCWFIENGAAQDGFQVLLDYVERERKKYNANALQVLPINIRKSLRALGTSKLRVICELYKNQTDELLIIIEKILSSVPKSSAACREWIFTMLNTSEEDGLNLGDILRQGSLWGSLWKSFHDAEDGDLLLAVLQNVKLLIENVANEIKDRTIQLETMKLILLRDPQTLFNLLIDFNCNTLPGDLKASFDAHDKYLERYRQITSYVKEFCQGDVKIVTENEKLLIQHLEAKKTEFTLKDVDIYWDELFSSFDGNLEWLYNLRTSQLFQDVWREVGQELAKASPEICEERYKNKLKTYEDSKTELETSYVTKKNELAAVMRIDAALLAPDVEQARYDAAVEAAGELNEEDQQRKLALEADCQSLLRQITDVKFSIEAHVRSGQELNLTLDITQDMVVNKLIPECKSIWSQLYIEIGNSTISVQNLQNRLRNISTGTSRLSVCGDELRLLATSIEEKQVDQWVEKSYNYISEFFFLLDMRRWLPGICYLREQLSDLSVPDENGVLQEDQLFLSSAKSDDKTYQTMSTMVDRLNSSWSTMNLAQVHESVQECKDVGATLSDLHFDFLSALAGEQSEKNDEKKSENKDDDMDEPEENLIEWLLNHAQLKKFSELTEITRSNSDDARVLSALNSLRNVRNFLIPILYNQPPNTEPPPPYNDLGHFLTCFKDLKISRQNVAHVQSVQTMFAELLQIFKMKSKSSGIQACDEVYNMSKRGLFILVSHHNRNKVLHVLNVPEHIDVDNALIQYRENFNNMSINAIEQEVWKKGQDIEYLLDIRSKVMMAEIPKDQSKDNDGENNDKREDNNSDRRKWKSDEMENIREAYVVVLQMLQEMRDQVHNLNNLGHFDYQDGAYVGVFKFEFNASSTGSSLLQHLSELRTRTIQWHELVARTRKQYYFLNHYTMRELLQLMEYFRNAVEEEYAPPQSKRQVSWADQATRKKTNDSIIKEKSDEKSVPPPNVVNDDTNNNETATNNETTDDNNKVENQENVKSDDDNKTAYVDDSPDVTAFDELVSFLYLVSSSIDENLVKEAVVEWGELDKSKDVAGEQLLNLLGKTMDSLFAGVEASQSWRRIKPIDSSKPGSNMVIVDGGVESNYHFLPVWVTQARDRRHVLDVVLSIYIRRARLPEPYEVLFCNHDTTMEEIELVFWQFINARNEKAKRDGCLFVIAGIHVLTYTLQVQVVDRLREMIGVYGTNNCASLVFISGEPSQAILNALSDHQVELPVFDTETLQEACQDAFQLTGLTKCVRSSINGGGKSSWIMKEAAKLQADETNDEIVYYRRVLFRESSTAGSLVKSLTNLSRHNAKTIFHIDISQVIPPDANPILFQLLIMGVLKDRSNYRAYYRRPRDVFYVEVPNSVGDITFGALRTLAMLPAHKIEINPEHLDLETIVFENDTQLKIVNRQEMIFVCRFLKAYRDNVFRRRQNEFDPYGTDITANECFEGLMSYCGGDGFPSYLIFNSFISLMFGAFTYLTKFVVLDFLAEEPSCEGIKHIMCTLLIETSKDFSLRGVKRGKQYGEHSREIHHAEVDEAGIANEAANSVAGLFAGMTAWENADHPVCIFKTEFIPPNDIFVNGMDILSLKPRFGAKYVRDRTMQETLKFNGVDVNRDWKDMDSAEGRQIIREGASIRFDTLDSERLLDVDDTYVLTVDNLLKMLSIQMRFKHNIPVIIMGETGCGKSSLINQLCAISRMPLFVKDIHGGIRDEDIIQFMKPIIQRAMRNPNRSYAVLLDEVNTTNAMGLFKEMVCDFSLNGVRLPSNIRMIAACNPYRLKTVQQEKATIEDKMASLVFEDPSNRFGENVGSGIKDPLANLVYRVHPLPESMIDYVFDFGALSEETEMLYVRAILLGKIQEKLRSLKAAGDYNEEDEQNENELENVEEELDEKTGLPKNSEEGMLARQAYDKMFEELVAANQMENIDEEAKRESQRIYDEAVNKKKRLEDEAALNKPKERKPNTPLDDFVEVFGELVCACHSFVRLVNGGERSVVSLRDVTRCVTVFIWFCGYMYKAQKKIEWEKHEFFNCKKNATSAVRKAVILSLAYCYYARLSGSERDGLANKLADTLREIQRNATFEPMYSYGNNNNNNNNSYFRRGASRRNGKCSWLLFHPQAFHQELVEIQTEFVKPLKLGPGIALNEALRENLFMVLVSVLNKIPIFVVGKPGSSKSLAMGIIQSNLNGAASENDVLKQYPAIEVFSYQCSPLSTTEGIEQAFTAAEKYMGVYTDENNEIENEEAEDNETGGIQDERKSDQPKTLAVVLLDEVGLAEQSPHLPLKVLHKVLDRRGQKPFTLVGISNWNLDPAKMNRAVHLFRPAPGEKDLRATAAGMLKGATSAGLLTKQLPSLAQAYINTYNDQDEQPDFWGLREFYSTVRHISVALSTPNPDGTMPIFDDNLVVNSVQRNFGGQTRKKMLKEKKKTPMQWFSEAIFNSVTAVENAKFLNVTELIQENLKSPHARHLMILTENNAALSLLFDQDLLNPTITEVIFGSDFPLDEAGLQVILNIQRIKLCMATGKTVVLIHCDSLYESLYDLLNQHYTVHGDRKYVRLAFGTHSRLCEVKDNFRVIVIVEKVDAYTRLPPPLLNRFEKQVMEMHDVLDLDAALLWKQLKQFALVFATFPSDATVEDMNNIEVDNDDIDDEKNVNEQLSSIKQNLLSNDRQRSLVRRQRECFAGFHSGTLASLARVVINNDKIPKDSKFVEAARQLLWIAVTESLCRMSLVKAKAMFQRFELHPHEFYFNQQQHGDLPSFCDTILNDWNNGSPQWGDSIGTQLIVMTYSSFTDQVVKTLRTQSNYIDHVEDVVLHYLSSERELNKRIEDFYKNAQAGHVLFVQCDPVAASTQRIEHARYICERERLVYKANIKNMENDNTAVESKADDEKKNTDNPNDTVDKQTNNGDNKTNDDHDTENNINDAQQQQEEEQQQQLQQQRRATKGVHVILLIHLSRTENSFAFDYDRRWRYAFVDTTQPANNEGLPDLGEALGKSTEEIFKIVDSQKLSLLLITNFRAAMTKLIYSYKREQDDIKKQIKKLTEALNPQSYNSIFVDSIRQQLLAMVQEHHTNDESGNNLSLTLSSIADDVDELRVAGHMQGALKRKLSRTVINYFAFMLSHIDRNKGLLLVDNENETILQLWKLLFPLSLSSQLTSRVMYASFYDVPNDGIGGRLFRSRFPFSFYINNQIEKSRALFTTIGNSLFDKEGWLQKQVQNLGWDKSIYGKLKEDIVQRFVHDFAAMHIPYVPDNSEFRGLSSNDIYDILYSILIVIVNKRPKRLSSVYARYWFVERRLSLYFELLDVVYALDRGQIVKNANKILKSSNGFDSLCDLEIIKLVLKSLEPTSKRVKEFGYNRLLKVFERSKAPLEALINLANNEDCPTIGVPEDATRFLEDDPADKTGEQEHPLDPVMSIVVEGKTISDNPTNNNDGNKVNDDSKRDNKDDEKMVSSSQSIESIVSKDKYPNLPKPPQIEKLLSKRRETWLDRERLYLQYNFIRDVANGVQDIQIDSVDNILSILRSKRSLRTANMFDATVTSLNKLITKNQESEEILLRMCRRFIESFIVDFCLNIKSGEVVDDELLKRLVTMLATDILPGKSSQKSQLVPGGASKLAILRELMTIDVPEIKLKTQNLIWKALQEQVSKDGTFDNDFSIQFVNLQESFQTSNIRSIDNAASKLKDQTFMDEIFTENKNNDKIHEELTAIAKARSLITYYAYRALEYQMSARVGELRVKFKKMQTINLAVNRLLDMQSKNKFEHKRMEKLRFFLMRSLESLGGLTLLRQTLLQLSKETHAGDHNWVHKLRNRDVGLLNFLEDNQILRLNPFDSYPYGKETRKLVAQLIRHSEDSIEVLMAKTQTEVNSAELSQWRVAVICASFSEIHLHGVITQNPAQLQRVAEYQAWISKIEKTDLFSPLELKFLKLCSLSGHLRSKHQFDELELLSNSFLVRQIPLQQMSDAHNTVFIRVLIDLGCRILNEMNSESKSFINLLVTLLNDPISLKDTWLPCQPEDVTARAVKILGGRWYKCPKGHAYYVDKCGRPTVLQKCVCGADIGGLNHNLRSDQEEYDPQLKGNTNYHQTSKAVDNDDPNYCLTKKDINDNTYDTVRDLPPVVYRILRFILHATMALGSIVGAKEWKVGMIELFNKDHHPTKPMSDELLEYFWKHCEHEWICLRDLLDFKDDADVAVILHMSILSLSTQSEEQPSILKSTAIRNEWEMNAANVINEFTNQENLQSAMKEFVTKYQEPDEDVSDFVRRVRMLDDKKDDEKQVMSTISNNRVWEFRKRFELNDFMSMLKKLPKYSFPLLTDFLQNETKYRGLRYLPGLLEWIRLLLERYNRRLDPEDAQNIRIHDVLEEVRKEGSNRYEEYRLAFDAFQQSWNQCWHFVEKFGCLSIPKHLRAITIDETRPISFCLPSESNEGICPLQLARYLGEMHNDFVAEVSLHRERYFEDNDEEVDDSLSGRQIISSKYFSRTHAITYDMIDFEKYVSKSCVKVTSNNKMDNFDFEAAEKFLLDHFFAGKPVIMLEVPMMQYRHEFMGLGESMSYTIRSEPLQVSVVEKILQDLGTLSNCRTALELIETCMAFIQTGAVPSRDAENMTLQKYASETLDISDPTTSFGSAILVQQVQIKHLRSIRRELKNYLTVDPFAAVSPKYREPLTDAAADYLNSKLEFINLSELLPPLKEYISNYLTDDNTSATAPLLDVLSILIDDESIEEHFPKNILMNNALAVYQFFEKNRGAHVQIGLGAAEHEDLDENAKQAQQKAISGYLHQIIVSKEHRKLFDFTAILLTHWQKCLLQLVYKGADDKEDIIQEHLRRLARVRQQVLITLIKPGILKIVFNSESSMLVDVNTYQPYVKNNEDDDNNNNNSNRPEIGIILRQLICLKCEREYKDVERFFNQDELKRRVVEIAQQTFSEFLACVDQNFGLFNSFTDDEILTQLWYQMIEPAYKGHLEELESERLIVRSPNVPFISRFPFSWLLYDILQTIIERDGDESETMVQEQFKEIDLPSYVFDIMESQHLDAYIYDFCCLTCPPCKMFNRIEQSSMISCMIGMSTAPNMNMRIKTKYVVDHVLSDEDYNPEEKQANDMKLASQQKYLSYVHYRYSRIQEQINQCFVLLSYFDNGVGDKFQFRQILEGFTYDSSNLHVLREFLDVYIKTIENIRENNDDKNVWVKILNESYDKVRKLSDITSNMEQNDEITRSNEENAELTIRDRLDHLREESEMIGHGEFVQLHDRPERRYRKKQLTDDKFKEIYEHFTEFSQLESLDLSINALTPKGVDGVIDSIKTCERFRKLNLSYNVSLGDSVISSLIPLIDPYNKRCTLRELYIDGIGLSSEGFTHLVKLLASNNILQVLHVANNNIIGDSFYTDHQERSELLLKKDEPTLMQILCNMDSLIDISLSQNNIGKRGLEALVSVNSTIKKRDTTNEFVEIVRYNTSEQDNEHVFVDDVRFEYIFRCIDSSSRDIKPRVVIQDDEKSENYLLVEMVFPLSKFDHGGVGYHCDKIRIAYIIEDEFDEFDVPISLSQLKPKFIVTLAHFGFINIGHGSKFRRIKLKGSYITSDCDEVLYTWLRNDVNLQQLDLSYCNIQSRGASRVLQAMIDNENSRLTHLNLMHTQLTDHIKNERGEIISEFNEPYILKLFQSKCKTKYPIRLLDLSDNDFIEFPADKIALVSKIDLRKLTLSLRSNKSLLSPPQNIANDDNLLRWFMLEIQKSSSPLKHMNVICIGHGGAGKTTFKTRILMDRIPLSWHIEQWTKDDVQIWLQQREVPTKIRTLLQNNNTDGVLLEQCFGENRRENPWELGAKELDKLIDEYQIAKTDALEQQKRNEKFKDTDKDKEWLYVSTVGINQEQMNPEHVDGINVTILDLAGQVEFFVSHELFLHQPYGVYVCVAGLMKHNGQKWVVDDQYMLPIRYWMSFLKSVFDRDTKVPLVMSMSRVDHRDKTSPPDNIIQNCIEIQELADSFKCVEVQHSIGLDYDLKDNEEKEANELSSEFRENMETAYPDIDWNCIGIRGVKTIQKIVRNMIIDRSKDFRIPESYEKAQSRVLHVYNELMKQKEMPCIKISALKEIVRESHPHFIALDRYQFEETSKTYNFQDKNDTTNEDNDDANNINNEEEEQEETGLTFEEEQRRRQNDDDDDGKSAIVNFLPKSMSLVDRAIRFLQATSSIYMDPRMELDEFSDDEEDNDDEKGNEKDEYYVVLQPLDWFSRILNTFVSYSKRKRTFVDNVNGFVKMTDLQAPETLEVLYCKQEDSLPLLLKILEDLELCIPQGFDENNMPTAYLFPMLLPPPRVRGMSAEIEDITTDELIQLWYKTKKKSQPDYIYGGRKWFASKPNERRQLIPQHLLGKEEPDLYFPPSFFPKLQIRLKAHALKEIASVRLAQGAIFIQFFPTSDVDDVGALITFAPTAGEMNLFIRSGTEDEEGSRLRLKNALSRIVDVVEGLLYSVKFGDNVQRYALCYSCMYYLRPDPCFFALKPNGNTTQGHFNRWQLAYSKTEARSLTCHQDDFDDERLFVDRLLMTESNRHLEEEKVDKFFVRQQSGVANQTDDIGFKQKSNDKIDIMDDIVIDDPDATPYGEYVRQQTKVIRQQSEAAESFASSNRAKSSSSFAPDDLSDNRLEEYVATKIQQNNLDIKQEDVRSIRPLSAGKTKDGKETVAQGHYATVFKGKWKDKNVAIKVPKIVDVVHLREIELRMSGSFPLFCNQIAQLLGVIINFEYKPLNITARYCMVMELADEGSMKIFRKGHKLSRKVLLRCALDVSHGLATMHDLNLIHRDIAPRNILRYSNGRDPCDSKCKLTDFGLSVQMKRGLDIVFDREEIDDDDNAKELGADSQLPIRYYPPESFEELKYTKRSDVWMFALCIWELITNESPWPNIPQREIRDAIYNKDRRLVLNAPYLTKLGISSDLIRLLEDCLNFDQKKRPTMRKVQIRLEQLEARCHSKVTMEIPPKKPDSREKFTNSIEWTEYQLGQAGITSPLKREVPVKRSMENFELEQKAHPTEVAEEAEQEKQLRKKLNIGEKKKEPLFSLVKTMTQEYDDDEENDSDNENQHKKRSKKVVPIDQHPNSWSPEHVAAWVLEVNPRLSHLAERFIEDGVDGKTLLNDVDDMVLKDCGVQALIQRRQVLKAISSLKRQYKPTSCCALS